MVIKTSKLATKASALEKLNKGDKMEKQKGFTLIEIVMVILLLGILAAVAIPRFWDLGTSADQAAADGGIAGIKSGITILNASIRVLGGSAAYPTGYPGNPIEGNVVSD